MRTPHDPASDFVADAPAVYRIRVSGIVEAGWARDMCRMEVVTVPGGSSELIGAVQDQSELLGVLRQLRDRGHDVISLVSISEREGHAPDELGGKDR